MKIDFVPVNDGQMLFSDYARAFTREDLRAATNESLDFMVELVRGLDDAQVTFLPHDPHANDPHAKPGEEQIGWSVAHLVVHVTASSEEWATFSSILARGIPYPAEPRLRYETEWTTVTTQAELLARLEESRRIRLAYLDAWPDAPNLSIERELSPRFVEKWGPMNGTACFLFGLKHEVEHHEQILEVARQAQEAVVRR